MPDKYLTFGEIICDALINANRSDYLWGEEGNNEIRSEENGSNTDKRNDL